MEVHLQELTAQDRETLKAISVFGEDGTTVRPGRLVAGLDVSPATVTARLKRLHDLGLADHVPYAGVTLTEQGIKVTVTIIRRHRIGTIPRRHARIWLGGSRRTCPTFRTRTPP